MKKSLSIIISLCLFAGLFSGFTVFAAPGGGTPENTAPPGSGYIVKLKSGAATLLDNGGLGVIRAEQRLYLVEDDERLSELTDAGLVEYAEPNAEMRLMGTTGTGLLSVPNDTYYRLQWGLSGIQADAAWDAGLTGDGVRLAILDSGITREHADLSRTNIEQGYNVLDNSTNLSDSNGHGTFISGIIAATRNNGIYIAGITDKVTIIPIKCFSDATTDSSHIVTAIYKAVDDYKADVINISSGMDVDLRAVREAVAYAAEKGVIIVSAAGNDGNGKLIYPAAYDSVVGVGSYGESGAVSGFSQKNTGVFVTAPGENIVSLLNTGGGGYASGSGTSFAAPYVAAMAVMAKQYSKSIDAGRFMDILRLTAKDLGAPGYDTSYGYGAVNVGSFVNYIFSSVSRGQFTDIDGHWAKAEIESGVSAGLFTGADQNHFNPGESVTRAMFVTTLYRMEGAPGVAAASGFSDVPPNLWYSDAVAWAVSAGVTGGTSVELATFSPEMLISREQMAAMLKNYADYQRRDTSARADISAYSDHLNVSSWALEGVMWANALDIVGGTTPTTLSPDWTATKAEIAVTLFRYMGI